ASHVDAHDQRSEGGAVTTQAPLQPGLDAASEYPRVQLFIAGKGTDGTGGEAEEIYTPATGELLGTVPHAGTEDLDRALDASQRGFKVWRAKTNDERGAAL